MDKPLISICIATYNSSLYIIETLESIKLQTYHHLELIVSDDCSKDDTVKLVLEWLNKENNKSRFLNTTVLTVQQNTGVSANCNRCFNSAKGEFVKLTAGDDILLPTCLEKNMQFVKENQHANIIFSQVKVYRDFFIEQNHVHDLPVLFPQTLMRPGITAGEQYLLLLISDRIHYTPSFFCKKDSILAVGGFDEENKLIEDYPMWLKLTKAGEKLHYFHQSTVGYRMHSQALNNVSGNVIFKPSALKGHLIRKRYVHSFLPWDIVAKENYIFRINQLFMTFGWNNNTFVYKNIHSFFTVYFNPFQYIYAFKKRFYNGKFSSFYA